MAKGEKYLCGHVTMFDCHTRQPTSKPTFKKCDSLKQSRDPVQCYILPIKLGPQYVRIGKSKLPEDEKSFTPAM